MKVCLDLSGGPQRASTASVSKILIELHWSNSKCVGNSRTAGSPRSKQKRLLAVVSPQKTITMVVRAKNYEPLTYLQLMDLLYLSPGNINRGRPVGTRLVAQLGMGRWSCRPVGALPVDLGLPRKLGLNDKRTLLEGLELRPARDQLLLKLLDTASEPGQFLVRIRRLFVQRLLLRCGGHNRRAAALRECNGGSRSVGPCRLPGASEHEPLSDAIVRAPFSVMLLLLQLLLLLGCAAQREHVLQLLDT